MENNKNVKQLAREIGAAIQADDKYIKYNLASEKADNDTSLQNMIGDFNIARMELSRQMQDSEKNADKITELDAKVRKLYEEIMAHPTMAEFNKAKEELDKLLKSIDYIITCAANGEDPMTCPDEAPSCTGSCATCGGCG